MPKTPKFLNLQDPDGEIRTNVECYLAKYRELHPDVFVGMSAILRMAIREGLLVLEQQLTPRMQDKLTGGKLKK